MTFSHRTRKGTFYISPGFGGWSIMFDGDNLGTYATPQQAAEDLANGYCSWPSFGNPSGLGIPEDLSFWQRSA